MDQEFSVRNLYEQYPYPRVSLFARMRRADSFLLNYEANASAAFGSTEFAAKKPRILVVGAGTFEPYVAALANPHAEIVALDFSEASLKRLRWRLRLHGLSSRVQMLPLDLLKLNGMHGEFHFIVATGVLHHLPNPSDGLRALAERLAPFGVLRTMLYSRFGRSGIYRIRALCQNLGLKSGRELRNFLGSLPTDHPLRIQFMLYRDARQEGGVQDGFFVAEDHPFDAWECAAWFEEQGLVTTKFLHTPSGQVEAFDLLKKNLGLKYMSINPWEKIGVLDRLSELESNYFSLSVRRREIDYTKELEPPNFIIGNPVLRRACPRRLHVKLLGLALKFGPKMQTLVKHGMKEAEAIQVFGEKNIRDWESALLLVRERAAK